MARIICLAIGYLCGLFQTGYFYSRKKDFDLRANGSGNSGTTNTIRTMGWKAGGIVFLGDVLKCFLAVFLVWLIYHKVETVDLKILQIYGAAGCILGHDYPFYLNFKGGKGMACTAGMIGCVLPVMIPIELAVFLIPVFTTRYVSLGSILVSIGLPIFAGLFHSAGWLYAEGTHMTEFILLLCAIGALNIFRHRSNIVRLLHGNENKIGSKKKS